ncbi:hypothetical protein MMC14_009760 [Varicellaria rhodocarpa]|nr:hypothetical protein [Varicellaria rhodocarpa]
MLQAGNGNEPQVMGDLQPPPRVTPSFVNPYSLQPTLMAVFTFYLAITAVTTLLRMYTKLYITKTPGWGDYTACLAMIGYIVYCACVFSTFPYGAGVHQWDVRLTDLAPFARRALAAEIAYPPAIFLAKLSVFLQFIHFFVPDHGSKSFYVVWAFIAFNFLFLSVSMLFFALQCIPIAMIWDPTLPGHCVDASLLYITVTAIILVSDVSMLLLPLIWQSMMSMKKKLGVSAVFAIGTIACVTSILHLLYSIGEYDRGDATFVLTQLTFATCVFPIMLKVPKPLLLTHLPDKLPVVAKSLVQSFVQTFLSSPDSSAPWSQEGFRFGKTSQGKSGGLKIGNTILQIRQDVTRRFDGTGTGGHQKSLQPQVYATT